MQWLGAAFASIKDAMGEMCHAGKVIEPDAGTKGYHDWKYEQQLAMYGEQVGRRESREV